MPKQIAEGSSGQGVWWLWAAASAVAISTSDNLIALAAVLPMAALTATRFHESIQSLSTFKWLMRAAMWLSAIRLLLQLVMGTPMGSRKIMDLPMLQLPQWLAGLRFGGPVTWESVEFGAIAGLRLAGLVAIVGAAAAVASPRRLLASPPPALRELAMLTSLAAGFLPQLARDADRLSRAARWRGEDAGRLRLAIRTVVPLTENALDRSVNLGASLALRGYGVANQVPGWRWLIRAGVAMFAISLGLTLTDIGPAGLRLATAVVCGVLLGIGFWQQRPESTGLPEWSAAETWFASVSATLGFVAIALTAGTAALIALLMLPWLGYLASSGWRR